MNESWVDTAVQNAVVYWHVYCNEQCVERTCCVFDRQFKKLSESGLLARCKEVRIVYIGTVPFPRPKVLDDPKINICYRADSGDEGPSSDIIYKACKAGKLTGPILYIHTKGVTRGDSSSPTWAWAEMMEFFVIERWREALTMLRTKRAVGCDFFNHHDVRTIGMLGGKPIFGTYDGGRWHYSGNMWWAQPAHIASLDPPPLYDRFACSEDWIASNVGPHVSHLQFGVLHTTSNVPYTRGPCDLYRHAYTKEYYEHGGVTPKLEWKCRRNCCRH